MAGTIKPGNKWPRPDDRRSAFEASANSGAHKIDERHSGLRGRAERGSVGPVRRDSLGGRTTATPPHESSAIEAMGMSLPFLVHDGAGDAEKADSAAKSGREAVVNAGPHQLLPRQIIDAQSFRECEIRVVMAVAVRPTGVAYLAIAHAAEVAAPER